MNAHTSSLVSLFDIFQSDVDAGEFDENKIAANDIDTDTTMNFGCSCLIFQSYMSI